MNLSDAMKILGANAEKTAINYVKLSGRNWGDGIKYVFRAIKKNPDLIPKNIRSPRDSADEVLGKWIDKYFAGYEQRISIRISKMPGTIADPMVDTIIQGRLAHLTKADLSKICYSHRLSMSAENILGLLLEEFLAKELIEFNWHYAWGETVRSVDFVHSDGFLLQIKNRDNSENSSSSRVRSGTAIEKWFRVKSSSGEYMWDELNRKFSTGKFSEEKFREFVTETISRNPKALPIEINNPWQSPTR